MARALAALAVAYFHSHVIVDGWPQALVLPIPGLKEHGYLGVNFFFAISGYVISAVCDKPGFTVGSFAIRRFFRLYPVYWVVILAMVLLKVCGVFMPTSYKLLNILYSMTLLPHGEDVQPFLAVTWSLEFEIMFYLLAALIVPIIGIRGLAAVLLGLVCWAYTFGQFAYSFHLIRTLNADFLAGVAAYLLRKPLSHVPVWILIPSGLLGYDAVSDWQIPFSGSCGGFLLVSGLANARWRWPSAPLRWLVKLGDASYSLYLLHLVVMSVFAKLLDRLGTPAPWTAEPIRFLCLGVCVWLSIKACQRIERPMIELGNRLTARQPTAHPAEVTAGQPAE
ncbi:MAG: acyltransferase [Bradyrhizobium sp.]|uniref:acyltransferase family protein n=1 Tax=Bradyrhizobium sp. TaxID=376 RepID=UPI001DA2BF46|nr:acyltransferase [Bradyrhizobium sp.]MBV9560140.1 acyltransferase [Bradyrhizobium sp.]